LIVTQSLSIVPALALAILTDLKLINIWQIIAIGLVLGTINAFDIPVRQSFVAEMVQKGQLLNAIALNSAAFNGARIIGPVAAGLIIAYMGITACFYINAISFLGVIVALFFISVKGRPASTHGITAEQPVGKPLGAVAALLKDLFKGLSFVRGEKDVMMIMLLVAVFSLLGIPFITFLPVFAEGILKVGAKGLGFMAGATGCGAIAAALAIAFRRDISRKGLFMFISGLIFASALLCFSFSRNFYVSIVILAFAGWGAISLFSVANSFIQLATPDALRGRVMSVYTLVFLGFAPIGNAIVGFMANTIGTPQALSVSSIICLLTMITFSGYLRKLTHLRLSDRTI
jgi:MFS family permease